MTLETVLQQITAPDAKAAEKAHANWNRLAKPLGSLGLLEDCVVKIAALTGNENVALKKRTLIVFCADNGVVAEGVSQSDETVTTAVATALGNGTSTVNYMAKSANCAVLPVNIGMKETSSLPGVMQCAIMTGTNNMTREPAMSREACIKAIMLGVELVRQEKEKGTDIICVGEMGIGNTTTTSAVASVLLNRTPEELTGRGAGLSDEGLERKTAAIKRAIKVNAPDRNDPIDVISKLGGLDLAGICGVCLGGAFYRVPVMLDGVITNAAALCAVRLCPNAEKAVFASHVSEEPAAIMTLNELYLKPLISAGLRLGEGSGAVLALPLLDQALSVYNSGHTFDRLGIDAYTPQ